MSNFDDFWKKRLINPNALGQAEKGLWKKIEPILNELLDELKANDKIEISFMPIEREHLKSLIENLNQTGINYNLLLHVADSPDKPQRFVKAISEFGFNEPNSTHLFIEVSVLLCVLNTELFKALLLFHLKDVNHNVSSFSQTMRKAAHKTWIKLRPYVDNDFRNSLAHGTWAIENKKIVLFKDAKLEPYEKLELGDFIIKMKSQNVLYACLVNVLVDKRKTDFFT
jgi:hypothetical protein